MTCTVLSSLPALPFPQVLKRIEDMNSRLAAASVKAKATAASVKDKGASAAANVKDKGASAAANVKDKGASAAANMKDKGASARNLLSAPSLNTGTTPLFAEGTGDVNTGASYPKMPQ
jgi:hypothetical protein